jgi:hypothetical protein
MLLRQISQRIPETTKILIDSLFDLFISVSKNAQMSISPMVISTHAISPFNQCYFSLSPLIRYLSFFLPPICTLPGYVLPVRIPHKYSPILMFDNH